MGLVIIGGRERMFLLLNILSGPANALNMTKKVGWNFQYQPLHCADIVIGHKIV